LTLFLEGTFLARLISWQENNIYPIDANYLKNELLYCLV